MPSTITTYHSFSAGTKARASQVNTNFSNHRGDNLPIYETTAAASDMVHNLGAADHRWSGGFLGYVDFKANTTTGGVVLRGDLAVTAGALICQIASITVAKIGATGFDGAYMKPSSIPESALAFTYHMSIASYAAAGNYSWTVPAAGVVLVKAVGSGAGGAGGGTTASGVVQAGGGGGGGSGAGLIAYMLSVTAGEVLSITVGAPGAAGGLAGNGGAGNPTIVYRGGSAILTLAGGGAPTKGLNPTGGAGGGIYGGAGGAPGVAGTSGITDGILTVVGGGGGGNFNGNGGLGGGYSFLGYAGGTPGNTQGGIAGGGGGGAASIMAAGGTGGTRGGSPAGPFGGTFGSGGGGGGADGTGASGGSGYIEFRYLTT